MVASHIAAAKASGGVPVPPSIAEKHATREANRRVVVPSQIGGQRADLIRIIRNTKLTTLPHAMLATLATACQGFKWVCRFCLKPYPRNRTNTPVQCCYRSDCRKKAKAERDQARYSSNPAKKIADVQRNRMQKAAAQKARAAKAG